MSTDTAVPTSPRPDVEGDYYIYALLDPRVSPVVPNDVRRTFYIGKGKGLRHTAHQKESLKNLIEGGSLLKDATKDARIQSILTSGERVEVRCLGHGFENERDAERNEAMTINVVSTLLESAGRPPLTNASRMKDSGSHPLGAVRHTDLGNAYRGGTPVDAREDRQVIVDGAGNARVLLVKGSTGELEGGGQRLIDGYRFGSDLDDHGAQVDVLEWYSDDTVYARRGWDPTAPWSGVEASERARRYWPISHDRVLRWLNGSEECPETLLLAIPSRSGRTVVRYAWAIDRAGTWQYFPQSRRWGVPLAEQLVDHPLRGAALYEDRGTGKNVQVLANYASGCRILTV